MRGRVYELDASRLSLREAERPAFACLMCTLAARLEAKSSGCYCMPMVGQKLGPQVASIQLAIWLQVQQRRPAAAAAAAAGRATPPTASHATGRPRCWTSCRSEPPGRATACRVGVAGQGACTPASLHRMYHKPDSCAGAHGVGHARHLCICFSHLGPQVISLGHAVLASRGKYPGVFPAEPSSYHIVVALHPESGLVD